MEKNKNDVCPDKTNIVFSISYACVCFFYILLFDQLIPDISKHGCPTKVPCF